MGLTTHVVRQGSLEGVGPLRRAARQKLSESNVVAEAIRGAFALVSSMNEGGSKVWSQAAWSQAAFAYWLSHVPKRSGSNAAPLQARLRSIQRNFRMTATFALVPAMPSSRLRW